MFGDKICCDDGECLVWLMGRYCFLYNIFEILNSIKIRFLENNRNQNESNAKIFILKNEIFSLNEILHVSLRVNSHTILNRDQGPNKLEGELPSANPHTFGPGRRSYQFHKWPYFWAGILLATIFLGILPCNYSWIERGKNWGWCWSVFLGVKVVGEVSISVGVRIWLVTDSMFIYFLYYL